MAHHAELYIAPEQLPEIADFIVGAKRRGKIYIGVGDNIGYFSRQETELRCGAEPALFGFWCGCSAGCLTVGIEANGNAAFVLRICADIARGANTVRSAAAVAPLWLSARRVRHTTTPTTPPSERTSTFLIANC